MRSAARGNWVKWIAMLVLTLTAPAAFSQTLVNKPYLQNVKRDGVTIRGYLNQSASVRVRYGSSPTSLTAATALQGTFQAEDGLQGFAISLSGLSSQTRYYYAVETSTGLFVAPAHGERFFETLPAVAGGTKVRAAIIGDPGENSTIAHNVAAQMRSRGLAESYQVILTTGDNAYGDGAFGKFISNYFAVFKDVFERAAVYPSTGNHDLYSGAKPHYLPASGPIFDTHTLPQEGTDCPASGTEAYFCVRVGNALFIILEAEKVDEHLLPATMMQLWLSDVMNYAHLDPSIQWTFAFTHRMAYSRGSHDSDDEINSVLLRQNLLPILESDGSGRQSLDVFFAGHSHNYERSAFLHGHYGSSNEYYPSLHAIDSGNGQAAGGGAYQKSGCGPGTAYVVIGNSSKGGGSGYGSKQPDWPHPAMPYSLLNTNGFMELEIDGLTLTVRYVDQAGLVKDHFTIQKTSACTPGAPAHLTGSIPGPSEFPLAALSVNGKTSTVVGNELTPIHLSPESSAVVNLELPAAVASKAQFVYLFGRTGLGSVAPFPIPQFGASGIVPEMYNPGDPALFQLAFFMTTPGQSSFHWQSSYQIPAMETGIYLQGVVGYFDPTKGYQGWVTNLLAIDVE